MTFIFHLLIRCKQNQFLCFYDETLSAVTKHLNQTRQQVIGGILPLAGFVRIPCVT
ncbi:unnamed protein product [Musa hybrid cultivar]